MFTTMLARHETIVAKVAIGIAVFVTNPNKTIQIGWIIALPPTPAMVHRALKKIRANIPAISSGLIGNADLCTQISLEHTSAQLSFAQSAVTAHFLAAEACWHKVVRTSNVNTVRESLGNVFLESIREF